MQANKIFNFGSVGFIKFVDSITPIIILPIIISRIGLEFYGQLVFYISLNNVYRIVINYGIETYGIKEYNSRSPSSIFATAISIQSINTFLIIVCASFLFNSEEKVLAILMVLIPFSEFFRLKWLGQGSLNFKKLLASSLIRTTLLVLLFSIVLSSTNYKKTYPLMFIFANFCASIPFWQWISQNYKQILFSLKWTDIIAAYRRNFLYLKTNLYGAFNTEATVFILQLNGDSLLIGIYDLFRKVIEVGKIPNSLINTFMFPFIAKTKNLVLANKVNLLRTILAFSIYFIINILFGYIYNFLTEENLTSNIQNSFWIMSSLIIITSSSYYTGNTLLVNFGFEHNYKSSVFYGMIFNLATMILLYYLNKISLVNICIAISVSELLVALLRAKKCFKEGLLKLDFLPL